MTGLNPYLVFQGRCKEAFGFYAKALNGEIVFTQTGGESGMDVPDEQKDLIMHIKLNFDGNTIMGSDDFLSNAKLGTNVHLSIITDDANKGSKFFKNLSKDGKVDMPMEKQNLGSTFGMLTDKYGIKWMVNVDDKS